MRVRAGTRRALAMIASTCAMLTKRGAISRGRDSYAVTAPLVCEAVERLLKTKIPAGAHAPGEIFDAKAFLESLGHDYTFEMKS